MIDSYQFDPKEFYEEIDDLVRQHPEYSRDDAFTFWFVNYLKLDERLADQSLTGSIGDKNIDALWIDDEACTVNILQAKLRETWGKVGEKPNDVLILPNLVKIFQDEEEKKKIFQGLDSKITRKLKTAIERVKDRDYKINLYYITTGRISKGIRSTAEVTGPVIPEFIYQIFDHTELSNVWEDWIEGVAPAIGSYDLPVETGNFTRSIINKTDSDIESWITTASSKNIAKMYDKIGKPLFAKNIRGFLGPTTPINDSMMTTVENEPEYFWYYNNGITIVCDDCVEIHTGGKTTLTLTRPQVINGQQTTRTLSMRSSVKAQVLIKVYKLPRKGDFGYSSYHKIVNGMVKATNWQNKIGYADLASNNPFQHKLEKQFRARRYQYLRKREKGSESRGIGFHPIEKIKKADLAKDVAACILGPTIPRLGPETLFDDDYYTKIFQSKDPDFYLSCYLLEKFVKHYKKKTANKYYLYNSNYLVIHLLWHSIGHMIDSDDGSRKFRTLWEQRKQRVQPLGVSKTAEIFGKMIICGFKMAWICYDKNKKLEGGRVQADTDFFRRTEVWKLFVNFSKTKNKKSWHEFEKLVENFKNELKKVQLA